ncbi:LysR family transcriptional regulator [Paracoccaceae bacterium Fryx2]|nr:LysR family transcriptional regulator [Paracoccaceae bacterium Fryx2]
MQIDLLETFLDLIETRSFNRSAERLGVTQSTVSGRIAALETALGVRLFTRSRAGTEITTEGLKFEAHARALRHAWAEATRALRAGGTAALSLRIGIQNDLAAGRIGDWVQDFRRALPDCAFYIEPDYSAQMCNDLALGILDFAVLFTPRALPELHVASLGDVRYRLISSDTASRAGLTPARYILANYAPAFAQTHAQLLPEFSGAPLASGQNAAVAGLLTTLGGAGFVLEDTARHLVDTAGFHMVTDVPAIPQPVFAAIHQRHRTSRLHRRLLRIVQRPFAAR